jgi:hypothetical protein
MFMAGRCARLDSASGDLKSVKPGGSVASNQRCVRRPATRPRDALRSPLSANVLPREETLLKTAVYTGCFRHVDVYLRQVRACLQLAVPLMSE